MKRDKRILVNFGLALITCLALIGLASPSFSTQTTQPEWVNQQLVSNLQQAESASTYPCSGAIAQSTPLQTSPTQPTPIARYVAVLTSGDVVAPASLSSLAFGAAGAALVGDRLVMRGDFSGLSSPLRDYATDPVSPPNPNITSGIHIHRGEKGKNGPFQYALTVEPAQNRTSGRFSGEYTLTSEQLQALSNGTLYVDLHTKQNRAGELRGILRPYQP